MLGISFPSRIACSLLALPCVIFLCAEFGLAQASESSLRFVRAGANTYLQVGNVGAEKCSVQIVIASDEKENTQGLFVHVANEKMKPQNFNLAELSLAKSLIHFFLEYDRTRSIFTTLQLGSNSWNVNGSFTLRLPCNTEITLDANNQYLTLVKSAAADQASAAVLGMFGLKVVFNSINDAAVALRANGYKEVLEPYTASASEITLQGESVKPRGSVGLLIEGVKNPCLKSGALFIEAKIYKNILQTKDRNKQLDELQRALHRQKSNPLHELIILLTEKTRVVGYDPEDGEVVIIETASTKRNLCTFDQVPVEF